jgi:BirA family biotin operon repressor/biotin-[acetyl-CoA-carboxylase] ligase
MPSLASAATALPKSRFSAAVHYFGTVDSTNQVARDLGRAGEPDGTVVVADEQTAGRGRRQRRWVSPPGAGLYVSLLLRPEFPAAESGSAVQLLAGIAAAEALDVFLPSTPLLRWPNDCFVLDAKIAGVLVEAETTGWGFDFLVCGIGVNVNHAADDFPPELRGRATSVKLQLGHRVSRLDVLAALLDAFETWESVWRQHGMAPIRERWLELSPESVAGSVSVQTEAGLVEGIADGLTDAGHLRVRADDGAHEISVGELIRARPS